MMDYWLEHAEIALSEAGLPQATPEQLEAIAGVIESAHDFFSQAMGHDVASANFVSESQRKAENAARDAEKAKEETEDRLQKIIRERSAEINRLRFALADARRKCAELGVG